jgi:hypothetical protein
VSVGKSSMKRVFIKTHFFIQGGGEPPFSAPCRIVLSLDTV